ncbi:hypothetical protein [Anabaena sp. CCY 0017]|uniref:hypothetical protein n=1 Tax=Anabaena sp. CCY 0017 TaxID=3103866 RepID=UPI0039C6B7F3
MDRNYQIAFVALLTLAITGCTIGDTTPEANVPTPTQPPAAEPPTKVEPFNVVSPPANASATPNLRTGLQAPTNAKERVLLVSKGRSDPFGQIVEQRFSPRPTGNQSPRPVPPIPPLPTPRGEGRQAQTPVTPLPTPTPSPPAQKPTPPNQDTSSVRSGTLPSVIPDPGLKPLLPPPPQPDLAKAVMVTGVVLIGQKPQAIIKVPTEETSRYVQAGQRLSSGLLIKRIEMNEGSDPIVVLEQYGIEVARMVGQEPINAASSAPNLEAS